ncbi:MAG TPA: bifunctional phosphopantothenoylcysteine decarboxylase/phosphopantothenate--cysteine ligase CoaBC [Lachnospiraceae bacterium]|nr:bifunctional phosphopantothenoylcysteine decarboxylase/phosphopantothenate--cysteine ligase CoaBC [Lachnospiraceae bacterium]
MLTGKTVVLGVTGSIAAYKAAGLASMLVKQHADVHVIMTKNATNFIHPIAFETLTNHKCLVDTFDRNFQFHVAHVNLAQQADLMMIAPASANVIGKLAHGIADDMLTTTAMACHAPMYISPAMNTNMYLNPILQENLEILRRFGKHIIAPATGMLACRDVGAGKMPEPELLMEYIMAEIACKKDLAGKKVLVSAGPTQEAIDPVRFISNHSTGKMGYALAENAMRRGAEVTLVSGPCSIQPPEFVQVVPVRSAQEMYDAIVPRSAEADIIIMTAAVADYRPDAVSTEKIKKSDRELSIDLTRTKDILGTLGKNKKSHTFLCGFSMETEHMLENSRDKLRRKNLDLIVANNLKVKGAGFGTDTNAVTLIGRNEEKELPLMDKKQVASCILDYIAAHSSASAEEN